MLNNFYCIPDKKKFGPVILEKIYKKKKCQCMSTMWLLSQFECTGTNDNFA